MKSQAKTTQSTNVPQQRAAAKKAAKAKPTAKASKPAPASKNLAVVKGEAIKLIALSELQLSDANVRKVGGDDVADLLASMTGRIEQGRAPLLQNLVVRKHDGGGFEVTSGGRRWRTLVKLASQGIIPADFGVACLVVDGAAALEDSVSENLIRKGMHPADEFQAFADLTAQGKTPAQIASRFNLKPDQVRRRLVLAKVSPALIERFRCDELELDHVMALTLTDDHALQEQIVGTGKRVPSAWDIKRKLSDGTVSGGDKRVTFVGLKAYEKAGGQRVTDLFAGRADEVDGGRTEHMLADEGLIERLALEKLQAHGESWAKKNGGVAWIEARTEYETWNSKEFGTVPTIKRDDTAAETVDRAAWTLELATIDARIEQIEGSGVDESNDAEWSEISEKQQQLQDKIESLDEAQQMAHPGLTDLAGVVVSLDYNGRPKITAGLVRVADRRAAEQAVKDCGVSGGVAGGSEAEQLEPKSLMRELTTVRSVVLQNALANDTAFALRLLAFQLATRIIDGYCYSNSGVHVSLTDSRDFQPELVASVTGSALTDELGAKAAQWRDRLGTDEETVWSWCVQAESADVLDLLAYCTAAAYSDVHERDDSQGRAVMLLDKLGVQVADHWKPSAANYYGKLKKAPLIDMLGKDAPEGAAKMKRSALAAVADETLTPRGWMPPVMG